MDRDGARQKQQQFMEIFGCADWDVYRKPELHFLYEKVGLAIFGLPGTGYDEKQRNHIKKVSDIIVQEDVHGRSGDTWMSIIILLVQWSESVLLSHPVFRVPKYTGTAYNQHSFIDCIGRVYRNWDDFLKNNKLMRSEVCYPVDGFYRRDKSGQVLIEFHSVTSLMDAADAISNTVARCSILAAFAALVFPAAPYQAMAAKVGSALCGLYGAARAIQDQVDRVTHGQSIGLDDKTSFKNWFSITIGLLRVRSVVSSSTVVRSGVKGFKLSGRSLSAFGKVRVAFTAANSVRDSVTPQEMVRDLTGNEMLLHDVSSYVLLFCHTVLGREKITHLQSSDEQQVLVLKSKILETIHCDKKVRYLRYVGVDYHNRPQIVCSNKLKIVTQMFWGNNRIFPLFQPTKKRSSKIEENIQECIFSTLAGKCFANTSHDMKVIIGLLS